jgi:DNA-binding transcriptional LysR family regulator
MTLEQLRIFVMVAERQHVTQAARILNIAQSAASHAIASLEASYDTKLFNRVSRRIELTEAGRAFLPEARTIIARVNRAEAALSNFGKLERGTLIVYASQTIASYWLPRHLVAFQRAHPHITVRLKVGNSAQVAEAIESGAAELGFVEGAIKSNQLESAPVALDQLVLVVGAGHPWVENRTLTPQRLTEAEWVLREPGSGTRSVFEETLSKLGVKPERLRITMELPSNEAVRSAVEAGLGATAISASVAAPSIEAGLLHHVSFQLPHREFRVLKRRQCSESRLAEAFLATLQVHSSPRMRSRGKQRRT